MADAQPDYSGSCMIALYPPSEVAGALAVPDGLEADDMHVTIAYTGDAADVDPEALNAAAKALAARPPFTATISGHARFTGGEKDVVVALVDAPELETLRTNACAELDDRGIGIPSEHGFTPHLTIRYLGQDEPDPVGRLAAFPVTFGAISAVHGKTRTDYPFADDMPGLAAEAYMSGWAVTGAPMTERVQAGCAAAVRLACEHRDDPRILETALGLGHLEGVQAAIARRREKLLSKHLDAVSAAWDACVKDLDAASLVRRFRHGAYLTSETADPQKQWWQDTATTAALGWLYAIYRADGYPALVAALEDAIREGMAEGEADALALAASRQGKTGFAVGKAFSAAYERLAGDGTVSQIAADATAKMADGAAGDIGRRLAKLAGDDASEDDMTTEVQGLASGDDARSPRAWTDWALWAGIGAGALALFERVVASFADRVLEVTWEDTGDSRECPVCVKNAKDSPYPLGSVPQYPAHPGDRCNLTTRTRIPLPFLAAFLN